MNYKYTLLSKIHGKKGMAKEQDKKTSRGMSCGSTRTRRLLKSDSLPKVRSGTFHTQAESPSHHQRKESHLHGTCHS